MEWFTVSEVSEKLNIPAETIRRYITRHQMHLYVRKGHKSYQIAEISISTLHEIRSLYGEGKQADEIDRVLAGGNRPTIVDVKDVAAVSHENVDLTVKALDDKLNAIANMLMNIDERLKEHEAFRSDVKGELTEVHKQVEMINKEVAAANESMSENISTLRDDMNVKLDHVLSRVETYKKQQNWFSRLFKS